jgi:hypothetical protein
MVKLFPEIVGSIISEKCSTGEKGTAVLSTPPKQ